MGFEPAREKEKEREEGVREERAREERKRVGSLDIYVHTQQTISLERASKQQLVTACKMFNAERKEQE